MTAITVTAAHIARGVPDSCTDCPVALAIAEAFPGVEVWVAGATVFLVRDGQETEADLPGCEDFIHSFDDRQGGEPFTFTLDYPAAVA